MDKLELKHLATYLPYGLKIKLPYGILTLGNHPNVHKDDQLINYGSVIIDQLKPILRPLSDLTKEIEHNGERFVPLMRLFEIAFGMMYGSEEVDKFDFRELDPEDGSAFGCFELNREWALVFRNNNFSCHKDYDGYKHQKVNNQIQLFQSLFQWHFDVFDLLSKNLAIDINTLNQTKTDK